MSEKKSITERLDALYEFDREPVATNKLQKVSNFIGLYAGEHVAGTEFVIGPLFVAHGVTAPDLFIGLLIGNILAVLSWAFFTAPIAVKTRLTLYWHLKRVAGAKTTIVYSLLNAMAFCILAGAMIAVASTAIGLPINLKMPTLDDFYPTSIEWVIVVFIVGAFVTVMAILGFEKMSHFAKICAPWMLLVFIASAVAVLPKLGCNSIGDFWRVANESIWTGVPVAGQSKFTIWHVICFTWFCNMSMHIGMSDMSILRYAKNWKYGFTSAFGMFLGHYVAWVASGILCAAAMGTVAPGPIAYLGAGLTGAIAVVITGLTTANPTLYRAGLALQTVTPDWKRWKVTILAGLITTIAACFPGFIMKYFEFLAIQGLIMMPIGVIIITDFWVLPRIGLKSYIASLLKKDVSWPAILTWVITLSISLWFNIHFKVEVFFLSLPGMLIAFLLYILISSIMQKRYMEYKEEVTV